MGKWFKLNKQKIFEGKNPVYISIQKQYRNKLYEDKMKENRQIKATVDDII